MQPSPRSSIALAAVLAAILTAPAVDAQTPASAVPAAAWRGHATPIHVVGNLPNGTVGGIWAAGDNYKVSFHDGMTFYPQVGPSLPNQPVQWRTTSVRHGEHELLAGAEATAPSFSAHRCEFRRGVVTERYDVRAEGLEQSFVIAQGFGTGDLVVTGEITSPLRLTASPERHGALALSLPDGRELVHYGAAIAIDANGVRTPVLTAAIGNQITLRMAAATVATAAFPLLIDPLLSTSTALGLGSPIKEVDVLHETLTAPGQQANMWFASCTQFAANDHDIRLWRVGNSWQGTPVEQHTEATTWDARHGRLALAPATNRVVLVYSVEFPGGALTLVHSHHVLDNQLVTQRVAVPGGTDDLDTRPDVGGRLGPDGSKVLITFRREVTGPLASPDTPTVYATVFDTSIPAPPGGPFTAPPFVVVQRANARQDRPVVTQASDSARWLLAFQELNNDVANDDWDITTVAVDGNGTVVPTNLDVAQAGDPLLHKIDPELAGAFGRHTLTYTTRVFELPNPIPGGDLGSTVYAQRVNWNHNLNTGTLPYPEQTLMATAGNSLTNESIAFDPVSRSHWCAGVKALASNRYRVVKLGFDGQFVETNSIVLTSPLVPSSLATTFSATQRRFPILYSENGGTNNTLRGTFQTYVSIAVPALQGFSCGSGVWTGLQDTGNRAQIGAEAMPFALTGAPLDSFAVLVLSTAIANTPGSLIGVDGCTVVPDLFAPNFLGLLLAPISGGQSSLSLDLPSTLLPFTLVAQWAYAVPGFNPLGFQLSEGISITIDR